MTKERILKMDVTELFLYRLRLINMQGLSQQKISYPREYEERISGDIVRKHRSISINDIFEDPSLLELK